MNGRVSRRRFLGLGVGATAAGLSPTGTVRNSDESRTGAKGRRRSSERSDGRSSQPSDVLPDEFDTDAPVDVRGAIYVPARAFNRYQMWKDYDRAVIERDLGYAARLNLNAIRTWMSYAYWLEDPEGHEDRLEHFLDAAADHDMRVVIGLHDSIGHEPTYENLIDDDPLTGVHTFSPATRTIKNERLWETPREYIRWFMQRYRSDSRLLAIELTNEPGWEKKDVEFMAKMAKTLTAQRGDIPLTVGATSLTNNTRYLDWGMDILQFHYNFAQTPAQYRRTLRQANNVADGMEAPVWLSEWQRIRQGDGFFANVSQEEAVPDYSSLAPIITDAGIGNFFWSLMVKPAYSVRLRRMGVINGLFHEDGAVWSKDDASAIKAMSGDPTFEGRERREYPDWFAEIRAGKNEDGNESTASVRSGE
ncbi:cellulase family glycosylhydrolase [Halomicrococcus sp. SG-WS-1]|uniref:cellulase family glycosylhydrolase n=1 Tax=Halomicrococcus sp. SG-WS-1 TaxID=3439057 RepID=UPI003F7B2C5C